MAHIPKNDNERMIARIDAVYDQLKDEDERVLSYIRNQLTPESIAMRHDEDKSVTHLLAVAKTRLKPYEKESDPS